MPTWENKLTIYWSWEISWSTKEPPHVSYNLGQSVCFMLTICLFIIASVPWHQIVDSVVNCLSELKWKTATTITWDLVLNIRLWLENWWNCICRIDEKVGNPWDLPRVAIDALGAAMLVTIILDLWRIFLGPIVPIPDSRQCFQPGLPWFPGHSEQRWSSLVLENCRKSCNNVCTFMLFLVGTGQCFIHWST